jgi:hypothetical protein
VWKKGNGKITTWRRKIYMYNFNGGFGDGVKEKEKL